MQIISIILFSKGADCPEHLFMPYKKTKVSLTRSSYVKGTVDLQPQITMSAYQPVFQALRLWVVFFFFFSFKELFLDPWFFCSKPAKEIRTYH